MFKIKGCFKTFDEGLIGYILGLPGTTAATLCNGGISFFEFLKERAKRDDLAYDDHINESKRQRYLSRDLRHYCAIDPQNVKSAQEIYSGKRHERGG
jgi:hypothetical protein